MFNQHLHPYFKQINAAINDSELENPTSKQASLSLRELLSQMQRNYSTTTTPENLYRRLATLHSLLAYHLVTLPKQQKITRQTSNWLRKTIGLSKTHRYMAKLDAINTRLHSHLQQFDTQHECLPRPVIEQLKILLNHNKMQSSLNSQTYSSRTKHKLHNNELLALTNKTAYPHAQRFELLEQSAAAHTLLLDALNSSHYVRDTNNQSKFFQCASAGFALATIIGGSFTVVGSFAIGLYRCDKPSSYDNALGDVVQQLSKKNAIAFADYLDSITHSLSATKSQPEPLNFPTSSPVGGKQKVM